MGPPHLHNSRTTSTYCLFCVIGKISTEEIGIFWGGGGRGLCKTKTFKEMDETLIRISRGMGEGEVIWIFSGPTHLVLNNYTLLASGWDVMLGYHKLLPSPLVPVVGSPNNLLIGTNLYFWVTKPGLKSIEALLLMGCCCWVPLKSNHFNNIVLIRSLSEIV